VSPALGLERELLRETETTILIETARSCPKNLILFLPLLSLPLKTQPMSLAPLQMAISSGEGPR